MSEQEQEEKIRGIWNRCLARGHFTPPGSDNEDQSGGIVASSGRVSGDAPAGVRQDATDATSPGVA